METAHITVYGIPNCDTVKKTRTWFADRGITVQFHDFKKMGVSADLLSAWIPTVGWQKLLNRQGTTWRKLAPDVQAAVKCDASAAAIMQDQPSTIKRPVVEWAQADGFKLTVGFSPETWELLLQART